MEYGISINLTKKKNETSGIQSRTYFFLGQHKLFETRRVRLFLQHTKIPQ